MVLCLSAELRGLLVGGGGLTFEARLFGSGVLLDGFGIGGKGLRLTESGLRDVVGLLLRGLATDRFLCCGGGLGGVVLSGAFTLDATLRHVGAVMRGFLLGSCLVVGLAQFLGGFLTLRVSDGLVGYGGLAMLRLGLLESPLLDQIVLAGHCTGEFFGFARDAIE